MSKYSGSKMRKIQERVGVLMGSWFLLKLNTHSDEFKIFFWEPKLSLEKK